MATAPKVDDRLLNLLAERGQEDALIDVVLRFELPNRPSSTSPAPVHQLREGIAQSMSAQIEAALAQAGAAAGEVPAEVVLYPTLGSARVQAHRPYVRALLKQAGVRGATLNTTGTGQDLAAARPIMPD